MRVIRDNGLTIFFGVIFLLALGGQAIAGHADYNNQAQQHAKLLDEEPQTISLGRYATSSSFARDVMENWQSEYLQFLLFIMATVWLLQRGSPESKELGKAGTESDRDQAVGRHAAADSPRPVHVGGLAARLYSNSLLVLMGAIFLLAWFAQSVSGWTAYNSEASDHLEPAVSWLSYLGTADFWERTLQNWQSEFLAVGSMAVFSIFLRQRGSPESKPVGAPHESTGTEG